MKVLKLEVMGEIFSASLDPTLMKYSLKLLTIFIFSVTSVPFFVNVLGKVAVEDSFNHLPCFNEIIATISK